MVNELWTMQGTSAAGYLIALAGGAACALFYFGGLWLTLRHILDARHPAVLVLLSFWVRTAIVAAAIFVLAGGRLDQLALCVVAMLVTRAVLLRLLPAPVRREPLHMGDERI